MAEITLKSTIDVTFVDRMGDDRRCVEAMLVSTMGQGAAEASADNVRGRLNFLMKNRHGTPYECGALTVRVHAPVKVWREWHRHRVGWSYNELSGRYARLEPVFWLPPRTRPMMRPEGFRSADPKFLYATDDEYERAAGIFRRGYEYAYERYESLVALGVDLGLARDVLGVGVFSACYCTCNPRSLMHFLELRTERADARRPSKPLWEIAEAARQLEAIFAEHWPITHALWCEHGRMAP